MNSSSKSRLLLPHGLDIVLQGLSRAIFETSPQNVIQFASFYFEELIVFREGNASLDIKDLIKQFHQIIAEKWSEATMQEKEPKCLKQPRGTPTVSQEPRWMEKSTDTEESNPAGPLFNSNKTTQFPSVHAEMLPEPEETSEAICGPSKPSTPKITTPHSLMSTSLPLQDEQELPAHDEAPEVPVQTNTKVTSIIHKTSIYKDEFMTYFEQIPEQIAIPLTDHGACLKENELLPPGSLIPVGKTAPDTSEKCAGSTKFAQLEPATYDFSIPIGTEGTLLIALTSVKGPSAQPLNAEASATAGGSETSLLLEVEVTPLLPEQQESWEISASQEAEGKPVLSGEGGKAVHSAPSVRLSGSPSAPVPEGCTEPETKPEWEAAPEQGLVEPAEDIHKKDSQLDDKHVTFGSYHIDGERTMTIDHECPAET